MPIRDLVAALTGQGNGHAVKPWGRLLSAAKRLITHFPMRGFKDLLLFGQERFPILGQINGNERLTVIGHPWPKVA